MKKIFVAFLVGIFLISIMGSVSAIEVTATGGSYSLWDSIKHLFGVGTFSVVGDSQGTCGEPGGQPSWVYEPTTDFQAGRIAATLSASAVCPSGHGLINLYKNGWTPFLEIRDFVHYTCSAPPCNAEIYCCEYPEPTSDAQCQSWAEVGKTSVLKTATCVPWGSWYRCTANGITEEDIPYSHSSFKYCSDSEAKNCYYYPGTGNSCTKRVYTGVTNCPPYYQNPNQLLYSSLSTCNSNIPECTNGATRACTGGTQTCSNGEWGSCVTTPTEPEDTERANGESCTNNADCSSNYCDLGGWGFICQIAGCGTCADTGATANSIPNGGSCLADIDCISNYCSQRKCSTKPELVCDSNSDCDAGEFCDITNLLPTPYGSCKLLNPNQTTPDFGIQDKKTLTLTEYYSTSDLNVFKKSSCYDVSDCSIKEGYSVSCEVNADNDIRLKDGLEDACNKYVPGGILGMAFKLIPTILVGDSICGIISSTTGTVRSALGYQLGVCVAHSEGTFGALWESILNSVAGLGLPASYVFISTILLLVLVFSLIIPLITGALKK